MAASPHQYIIMDIYSKDIFIQCTVAASPHQYDIVSFQCVVAASLHRYSVFMCILYPDVQSDAASFQLQLFRLRF